MDLRNIDKQYYTKTTELKDAVIAHLLKRLTSDKVDDEKKDEISIALAKSQLFNDSINASVKGDLHLTVEKYDNSNKTDTVAETGLRQPSES